MRIQRMLKRYRDELGEPIAIYQARPGWKAWLLLFAVLAAGFSVLVMGSDAGAPVIIGAGVGVVLLFYFFFYTQIGEFLAVCERGFAAGTITYTVGYVPFIIRFDQIVPGTVVAMTHTKNLGEDIWNDFANSRRPPSLIVSWYSQNAIYFVGPSAEDAHRGKNLVLESRFRALTPDGHTSWIVPTGKEDARTAIAHMSRAAALLGLKGLAQASESVPVVKAIGSQGGLGEKLPGYVEWR